MAKKKRREIVLRKDKLVPVSTGYSLGTVYKVNYSTNNTYELLNFGYCPIDSTFYYNRNVDLPEEIINYCQQITVGRDAEIQMKKMGIFSYDEVEMLLNSYYRAKDDVVRSKQKILNIKDILKYEDK